MGGGKGRHLRRVRLTGLRIGLRREQLLVEALAFLTRKTGMSIIAVRHSWPAGGRKRSPMASTAVGPSATWGWPPASEKRPVTGTRPGANTAALDSRTPWPLLSKLPAMQTPLAWLRRKPGWAPPFTCSNLSMKRASPRRPGDSQPATKAKQTAMARTLAPIAASLVRRAPVTQRGQPVSLR